MNRALSRVALILAGIASTHAVGVRAAEGTSVSDAVPRSGVAAAPADAPAGASSTPAARPAAAVPGGAAEGTAPAAQKPGGAGSRAVAAKAPGARGGKVMDRLELDTTAITGNRELPKVMVVVPWKKSDIGDLVGKPVNSLIDEALQPVDREVFRREIDYYGALGPDRPRTETPVTVGAPASAPEK